MLVVGSHVHAATLDCSALVSWSMSIEPVRVQVLECASVCKCTRTCISLCVSVGDVCLCGCVSVCVGVLVY